MLRESQIGGPPLFFFVVPSSETIAKLHTILTLMGIENHGSKIRFSVKKGQQILNRFLLLLNDHHEEDFPIVINRKTTARKM